ncbi:MAG: DsbC family protein [Herbaspirillum sp.]
MKKIKCITAAFLICVAGAVAAATVQEAKVKKLIEPRLGNGAKVQSVVKTPYSGLFEVRVGDDILYTDADAKYLFVGRVVNSQTYQDYTKDRIDEISKIKFSDLPFESALKTVKGKGERKIAVFEDPNCGYCKKFRNTLEGVDNVTVYTFMYNILAADSAVKSKDVWCSPNRSQAWDDWMLKGKLPASAAATCSSTPNDKILALGQQLKITGTPTIFFTDGTRIPGAIDAKSLEAKFASVK